MKEKSALNLCSECAEIIDTSFVLSAAADAMPEKIKCANCRKQRWGKTYTVKGVRHG